MSDNPNPYRPPEADLEFQPLQPELAERSQRFFAAMLDGLLLMGIYVMLLSSDDPMATVDSQQMVMEQVAMIMVYFAINGYLLIRYGQSIGKRLLNIRIVDISGKPATFTQIIGIRELLFMGLTSLPTMGLLIAVIDVLLIFKQDRRCMHDLFAGTKVIRVRS